MHELGAERVIFIKQSTNITLTPLKMQMVPHKTGCISWDLMISLSPFQTRNQMKCVFLVLFLKFMIAVRFHLFLQCFANEL